MFSGLCAFDAFKWIDLSHPMKRKMTGNELISAFKCTLAGNFFLSLSLSLWSPTVVVLWTRKASVKKAVGQEERKLIKFISFIAEQKYVIILFFVFLRPPGTAGLYSNFSTRKSTKKFCWLADSLCGKLLVGAEIAGDKRSNWPFQFHAN